MTTTEFSDQFDTLLNSYAGIPEYGNGASKLEITLDEYEKSVFLTRAQKQFVVDYYSGENLSAYSFEEKEKIREALDTIVDTFRTSTREEDEERMLNDGKHHFALFRIPGNLLWIVYEQVKYTESDKPCTNGSYAEVVPATHDELHRRLRNPFRGPKLYRVLRLNVGDNLVELISDYPIGSYLLRYVKEPTPIILTNLSDGLSIDGESDEMTCALPDIIHPYILDYAVRLALQSRSIGTPTTRK